MANNDGPVQKLTDYMGDVMEGRTSDSFYYYEPWDTPEDNRDYGSEGFQRAYHQSIKPMRMSIAGNRLGKSHQMGYEAVIAMTGEVPYSLRYEEGFETNIPRLWEDDGPDSPGALNRIRFGFIDPDTGRWHPPNRDRSLKRPTWPSDAPCGYIIGAGVYPSIKISTRKRDSFWICTYKVTRDERWVKFLADIIPAQFKDTRWNADGYSVRDTKFRLTNGNEITFITYEQGPSRAQGANIFGVALDEEPKDRKFWTEVDQRLISAGFDGFMSMSFTPLLGLSWSYYDLFLPVTKGLMQSVDLFHATQYDSPFFSREMIDRKKQKYKNWEIQARIYGKYSEMQGRPYFDFDKLIGDDITVGWVPRFIPRSVPTIFRPKDLVNEIDLLSSIGSKMVKENIVREEYSHEAYYEVFEEGVDLDCAYFMTCDTAEGHENEEMAADANSSMIFRTPRPREDISYPILVAAMRTTMPTLSFARECWYAAIYYNYCTMIPETTGETGASFATEIRRWPFFYHSTVVNDKTRKTEQKWGFKMTASTRRPVWDMVGDYIDSHDSPQCMRFEPLLRECAAAIYGKNGRPDHPDRGHSDCIISFGIGLYAYKNGRSQLRNNREAGIAYKANLNKKDEFEDDIFSRYKLMMPKPSKFPGKKSRDGSGRRVMTNGTTNRGKRSIF